MIFLKKKGSNKEQKNIYTTYIFDVIPVGRGIFTTPYMNYETKEVGSFFSLTRRYG
jgi:hypothetical protein